MKPLFNVKLTKSYTAITIRNRQPRLSAVFSLLKGKADYANGAYRKGYYLHEY